MSPVNTQRVFGPNDTHGNNTRRNRRVTQGLVARQLTPFTQWNKTRLSITTTRGTSARHDRLVIRHIRACLVARIARTPNSESTLRLHT